MAVDFFFCLGGFLIAEAYGERLDRDMSVSQFARTRVLRLYPVIVLGTLLGFLFSFAMTLGSHVQSYTTTDLVVALGLNLVFIPNLANGSPIADSLYPLNSPFWSLLFQLMMNFAWALYFRKISSWLLLGMSIALAIATFMPLHSIEGGSTSGTFDAGTVRVLLGFSGGLVAHDLLKSGRPALPRVHPLLLLALLMTVFAAPVNSLMFDLTCATLIFPALTLLGANAAVPGGSQRLLGWLGDISFPLYGIHKPVVLFMLALYKDQLGHDINLALFVAVALPVTLIASTMGYHWFDVPARRLLLRRRRSPVPAVQIERSTSQIS